MANNESGVGERLHFLLADAELNPALLRQLLSIFGMPVPTNWEARRSSRGVTVLSISILQGSVEESPDSYHPVVYLVILG